MHMILLISLKLAIDLLVHNNEKIERSKWFLNISRLDLLLSSSLLPVMVKFVVLKIYIFYNNK
jgi:hypothetical protein